MCISRFLGNRGPSLNVSSHIHPWSFCGGGRAYRLLKCQRLPRTTREVVLLMGKRARCPCPWCNEQECNMLEVSWIVTVKLVVITISTFSSDVSPDNFDRKVISVWEPPLCAGHCAKRWGSTGRRRWLLPSCCSGTRQWDTWSSPQPISPFHLGLYC